jgi:DNA-binding protein HU-beta
VNKAELVEMVAEALGDSKAGAERCVNAVLESIRKGTKNDKTCSIIGFGTFSVRKRNARIGRNPQTGAEIKIKPSTTVGFKPSQKFKEFV